MMIVCYVRMYLKLGLWDRAKAVKMVIFAVQVRRNRFPCGTNRFPLVKTEKYGFWVAGNPFPCRDNPVPHSKNQRRDFEAARNRFPRRDNPVPAALFLKMFYLWKLITFDLSIRFMCRFGHCEANEMLYLMN